MDKSLSERIKDMAESLRDKTNELNNRLKGSDE